jgi:flavin reductase (DIM6/NTAB) family NADH-FMN oxidoreductase RutF
VLARAQYRNLDGDLRVAIGSDLFKAIMSRWASGVTVVTAHTESGEVHGMTASSFSSVSLSPPLVLVCVNRKNRTHDLIIEQRRFGIHLLAQGVETLSNRCAGFQGEEAHLLTDVPNHIEVTGAPILDDSLSWMDCSLWAAYDGGDHSIFVGEIAAGGAREGEPLLWFGRGYRRLEG